MVHECLLQDGLYYTDDLSWMGVQSLQSPSKHGISNQRITEISDYINGVTNNAMIIQAELASSQKKTAMTSTGGTARYSIKADAVDNLHVILGHLLIYQD